MRSAVAPIGFPLRSGRVHEVCGPGSFAFAAIAASVARGSVLWVRENWLTSALDPLGLAPFLDPARLLVAHTGDKSDSLAVSEEALRDGAIPFVVVEVTGALNLREGRRLQLAAKAGNATGLCIIPEGMGSNAAETRWQVAPIFDPVREDSTLMRWEIIKNKSGTNGVSNVRWDPETHRLHVVSPAGERPGSKGAPG